MPRPLRLALQGSAAYQELALEEPLAPLTWAVTRGLGASESRLAEEPLEVAAFFEDIRSAYSAPPDAIYVSVAQDAAGEHSFINLGAAWALLKLQSGERLVEVPEAEVKALRETSDIVLLYAQAAAVAAAPAAAPAAPLLETSNARGVPIPLKDDLCPHRSIWASNYTVIPDLSVGLTQRLILCNESTLCRVLPEELIFDHLRLIVNCHESHASLGKYQVGACGKGRMPTVVCQAVHQWFSLEKSDMNRANDRMQEAIWEHLQQGTVAVHCLAGIHRAACIVACHYLWRHYALGQRDLPRDEAEIYRRLQAVRPAVEPAYLHVLANYAGHLRQRHGS